MGKVLITQDGCRIVNMDHFLTAGVAEVVGGTNYKSYAVVVTLETLGIGGNSNQQISKPIEVQVSVHETVEECKEDIQAIFNLVRRKTDLDYCDLGNLEE